MVDLEFLTSENETFKDDGSLFGDFGDSHRELGNYYHYNMLLSLFYFSG